LEKSDTPSPFPRNRGFCTGQRGRAHVKEINKKRQDQAMASQDTHTMAAALVALVAVSAVSTLPDPAPLRTPPGSPLRREKNNDINSPPRQRQKVTTQTGKPMLSKQLCGQQIQFDPSDLSSKVNRDEEIVLHWLIRRLAHHTDGGRVLKVQGNAGRPLSLYKYTATKSKEEDVADPKWEATEAQQRHQITEFLGAMTGGSARGGLLNYVRSNAARAAGVIHKTKSIMNLESLKTKLRLTQHGCKQMYSKLRQAGVYCVHSYEKLVTRKIDRRKDMEFEDHIEIKQKNKKANGASMALAFKRARCITDILAQHTAIMMQDGAYVQRGAGGVLDFGLVVSFLIGFICCRLFMYGHV
jgi:hypothetical protein